MKRGKITLILITLAGALTLSQCNSSRTNTEADRQATTVQEGDTINPREGIGEGTTGHKFMETTDGDSTNIEQ